jgi:hypothetical protein
MSLLIPLGLLSQLGVASAQMAPTGSLPAIFDEPMPHVPAALGHLSHEISTSSEEAQAFFDQGFQLMIAFGKYEAVRSFREASVLDPDCAMCYWGEAWAWGSYLNVPMADWEAPHAYAAMQKALALRDRATPRERDYIDALSARYVAEYIFDRRREQDEAYAEAMRALAAEYPDDLDAAALYADALFLLIPRRGYRDINDPAVVHLLDVLEGVLARDIRHPGACHLYVHATESTVDPGRAEACAEFLGDSIPGASHINHMPSHTWNEIGRWGDSVRANLKAWHSDQKAAIGEGVAIYAPHNLHMLLFAASYDGQGAIAMQAGKDHAKLTGDGVYQALTLLRFGRFDEILELTERPRGNDFSSGMWDFAQGYARLRNGEEDLARVYLERVERLAATTEATYRFDTVERLLGVVKEILAGEIHLARGDRRAAIAALERAVAHEDALDYDEPEPLPFAARHWLGAALLEAGRYRDAERVYREELEDHPHNGWSLFGLKAALEAQGKPTGDVDEGLAESWARADVWIRASRF